MAAMISVLYEDNHIIVVEKPCNIPMQEDDSKDKDLLTMVKEYLKEKYQKPGNVYVGLVHRLDRPVGGVCVFAKTSKAAGRLSDAIREHRFQKEYLAVVKDKGLKEKGDFHDKLFKDHKTNTVTVDPRGKDSHLSYEVLKRKEDMVLVHVYLHTGRSHQIRVQFASRGHALYGDQRYNKEAKKGEQIALWSHRLTFPHPTLKEEMTFVSNVHRYPFD